MDFELTEQELFALQEIEGTNTPPLSNNDCNNVVSDNNNNNDNINIVNRNEIQLTRLKEEKKENFRKVQSLNFTKSHSFAIDLSEEELLEIQRLENEVNSTNNCEEDCSTNNFSSSSSSVDNTKPVLKRTNLDKKQKKSKSKIHSREYRKEKKEKKAALTNPEMMAFTEYHAFGKDMERQRSSTFSSPSDFTPLYSPPIKDDMIVDDDFTDIDQFLFQIKPEFTHDEKITLKKLIISKLEKNLKFRLLPLHKQSHHLKDTDLLQLINSFHSSDHSAFKSSSSDRKSSKPKQSKASSEVKPKKRRARVNSNLSSASPFSSDQNDSFADSQSEHTICSSTTNPTFTINNSNDNSKKKKREKSADATSLPPFSPSSSPSFQDMNQSFIGEENNNNADIKIVIMKIKMPNNSHKSFPINEETTAAEIIDKLRNKLNVERPGLPWSSCELYRSSPSSKEEIILEKEAKLLSLYIAGWEFVFKQPGEKEVNREEELLRIIEENQRKEKEKRILIEMSSWASSINNTATASKRALSDPTVFSPNRRNFQFFSTNNTNPIPVLTPQSSQSSPSSTLSTHLPYNPSPSFSSPSSSSFATSYMNSLLSPTYSKEEQTMIYLKRIEACIQDINGIKEKINAYKKTKNIPVDTSDVLILKKLSDKSKIIIYSALVGGWTAIMKEFSLTDSYSPQLLQQLTNEISVLDVLPFHPNIVKYLFHEKTSKRVRIYLSMYSCSLRDVIDKRKQMNAPFQIKEIKDIILSIINGVIFLHSYCIIHRLLSPENIFCNIRGNDTTNAPSDPRNNNVDYERLSNVCIGGYDFAQQLTADRSNIMSKIPIGLSAPIYSAPESKQFGYHYCSDVYSLGIILFELLTLSTPKEGELMSLSEKHMNSAGINLKQLTPSAQVIDAVLNAIHKIPTQRPTAVQFKEMIESIDELES